MDQQTPGQDQGKAQPGTEPGYGKRLPRTAQLTLLALVSAALFVALFAGPIVSRLTGLSEYEANPAAISQGGSGASFRLTDRQWATLKIAPVNERVFQQITEADGKIAWDDDLVTPVFSPYSGRITKLMAHAGDTIAAGQPLFAIQASELAQAQNDLITAAANLRTAKAQLTLATTNEKRQHDLYLAKGAALKDWQQAQLDLATAQGGLNSGTAALAAVRNRLRILGKTDPEISEIEATADVSGLPSESVVTAPIGGTVVQRQAGLGQNIISASSGASSPVFTIGDLSTVWLVANVREEDAPRLYKGAAVDVIVLALPGRTFRARLTYIGAAIDPVTHRLPVRAEIDNANGLLKPEMFASFRIITGEGARFAVVPDIAVVHEIDSAHVWVANPADKTLELRMIKIATTQDGVVAVRDGLKPGEQIVTSGAVFIDRAATGD
jgi:cobalt-zinc-cadmium efflux system membrane fusion protein